MSFLAHEIHFNLLAQEWPKRALDGVSRYIVLAQQWASSENSAIHERPNSRYIGMNNAKYLKWA